jgi:hypothetical protein
MERREEGAAWLSMGKGCPVLLLISGMKKQGTRSNPNQKY